MINTAKSTTALALLLAAFVAACNAPLPRTTVERVAKAESVPNAPYARVLVVAMLPLGSSARELEEVLVSEMRNSETYAFGYRRAASRADVDQQVVQSIAEKQKADAVLVVTAQLVDASVSSKKQQTDVQARVKGGNLLDAFRYDYDELTTPTESDVQMKVRLVTDLYDVETGSRLYTIESTTEQAETSSEVIIAESQSIAKRLRKDKLTR